VPREWRGRFLKGVADRLLPRDELTDELIVEAIASVLVRLTGPRAA
jgi:hypothetical protein